MEKIHVEGMEMFSNCLAMAAKTKTTLDPSILLQVPVLSLKQLGFIKIKWEEVVH